MTQICTKSFVGCGFVPDITGELTALPRSLAVFRGLLLKGEEVKGNRRMEGRGEEKRKGEEKMAVEGRGWGE